MALTYTLIASNTLSSTASTVTFSSIPNSYTDLVVRASVRRAEAGRADFRLAINADTTSGSYIFMQGNGSAATSGIGSAQYIRANNTVPSSNETANTFGNIEIYIPRYLASANKPVGIFGTGENDSVTSFIQEVAGLYSQTTAITSLQFSPSSGTFASGSSFFLYGIKNS